MSILLDTGVLYAYYDRRDSWHRRSVALLRAEAGGLVVPAPVIPEVDHLLGHRLGAKARHAFYQGLIEGDYVVADVPHDRYEQIAALDRRFEDLQLGFVDASIAVLAEFLGIGQIATTDRRHFAPLAAALSFDLRP